MRTHTHSPAVDVHFFVVPGEERERLTHNCTPVIPGAQNTRGDFIQCSDAATDEATRKFFKLPPPEYTTGFAQDTTFGDHAVIGHGIHLLLAKDMAPGGAACATAGSNPKIAPQTGLFV